ncbi:MAG TPA: hypothetical protein DEO40_01145 [Treponema sp.]|nr:hypothetical protein [Treponema sp.]HBB43668.1 hypothetical protein [Treponema sp.]HCA19267.1 hypothetical protein [Treponema sp.]
MERKRIAVIIPSLNPYETLTDLTASLFQSGFQKIVIVDDASFPSSKEVFSAAEKLGATVLHTEHNLGKGASIKTAFKYLSDEKWEGDFLTADADGQHRIEDICKTADTLLENPHSLILGTRDFSKDGIPGFAKRANKLGTWFFNLTNHANLPDALTGLRGIPHELLDLALTEEGSRFEYEMNFLGAAIKKTKPLFIPVEAVYESGNSKSHFRPLRDSARFFIKFFRFMFSSLSAAAVDWIVFIILRRVFAFLPSTTNIFVSTTIARICSGIENFFVNKKLSFKSNEKPGIEILKFTSVFVGKMLVSAALVAALDKIGLSAVAGKLIVDNLLFFVSYFIQKNWVFMRGKKISGSSRQN